MSDSESKERMAEAADKLDSALGASERNADEGTDEPETAEESEEAGESLPELPEMDGLIDRVETDIESLLGVLNGEIAFSEAREDIEDLGNVIEETGELLDTVDMSQLPDAIDIEELPSAIDADELPEAIATLEPGRAVELTQLASLVEFNELWGSVDVREFIRNKEELEDATDEVTDDDPDDDDSETDDSSILSSSDDSGTDSSILGSSDEGSGTDSSMLSSSDDGPDTSTSSADGPSLAEQQAAAQATIQSKLRDAIGEFRESVLDTREQVKEARETANEKIEAKTGGDIGQPSSRNPTAVSTMTAGWKTGSWSSTGYSTVPAETRHSGAPNHPRLYGSRFEGIRNEEADDE